VKRRKHEEEEEEEEIAYLPFYFVFFCYIPKSFAVKIVREPKKKKPSELTNTRHILKERYLNNEKQSICIPR
jgi:hypothetical protein